MVHFSDMPGKIVLETVSEVLRNAEKRLRPKKIHCAADADEGRLDAEVLLSHVLKKDRAWIIAHGNDCLSGALRARFEKLVERREAREPVAYITGHKAFYGREFAVTPATLVPRPDTETIIDVLRSHYPKDTPMVIVDIGTGSGAIAITAALEFKHATVIATDISRAALKVAATNAKKHRVARRMTFVRADLLSKRVIDTIIENANNMENGKWKMEKKSHATTQPRNHGPIIFLANLPYLPERDVKKMDRDVVDYEPHEALFSGKDGLDDIRRLFEQIENEYPTNPDLILAEFDPPQKKTLLALAKETFPLLKAKIHNDLAGRNRVIAIR